MGGTMVYDSGRRPDSLRSPVREQYGAMEITPTGGALGAYVSDIDLSAPLDVEVQQQLRASWLEHLVLVFRDQPISEAAFLTFAQGFGTPGRYPFVTGLPDYPDIIEVKKLEHERNNFGGIWHSDTAYLLDPPMASMLVARQVPAGKGDTEFANMYTAWEQLPEDVRNTVRPLRAVNRSDQADVSKTRADRLADEATTERASYKAVHPAARTHPETGRTSLYVNVAHTSEFVGQSPAESQPLLQQLFDHQIRPEFIWRLQWEPGTIALWDNRCTLHNPINDYDGHRRVMHRITLKGSPPQ